MCRICLHLGFLASSAQECGRPPLMEDRIVGGMNAADGAWPWQVDIQVGSLWKTHDYTSTASKACAVSCVPVAELYVRCIVGLVEQSDLLREGFACDAEVTHSFSSPWLPDSHWRSYLWRLHHHGELGPISRSLFPQVRKTTQPRLKTSRWTVGWASPHRLCASVLRCLNHFTGKQPLSSFLSMYSIYLVGVF